MQKHNNNNYEANELPIYRYEAAIMCIQSNHRNIGSNDTIYAFAWMEHIRTA